MVGQSAPLSSLQMIKNSEERLIHWLCHHSEGPGRAGEMGREESQGFQQEETKKVLYLGRNDPVHQHMLGTNWPGSISTEKDLGILVDSKLTMSWEHTLTVNEANSNLGCVRNSVASRLREGSSLSPQPW